MPATLGGGLQHLWFDELQSALQAQHAGAAIDRDIVEPPFVMSGNEVCRCVVPAQHIWQWRLTEGVYFNASGGRP